MLWFYLPVLWYWRDKQYRTMIINAYMHQWVNVYPTCFKVYPTQYFNSLRLSGTTWHHGFGQHIFRFCCLIAPSHYLNQCYLSTLMISTIQWNSVTVYCKVKNFHPRKLNLKMLSVTFCSNLNVLEPCVVLHRHHGDLAETNILNHLNKNNKEKQIRLEGGILYIQYDDKYVSVRPVSSHP